MNKKAKKRAFLICAAIFVLYVVTGLGLTEHVNMNMKRIVQAENIKTSAMGLAPSRAVIETRVEAVSRLAARATAEEASPPKVAAIPPPRPAPAASGAQASKPGGVSESKPAQPVKSGASVIQAERIPPVSAFTRGAASAEPSLLISVPIVCYAIRAGLIEKEGLIFVRKEGYNTPSWKNPLDILKDKDEEGLARISRAIGKKQILAFLEKEGIKQREENKTDVILGKGYAVEKKKLLGLYDKYVSADYQEFFPFFLDGVGVARGRNGFEIIRAKDMVKERRDEGDEWMMPNLTNLPIRDAIAKISPRTGKIKVFGSGVVTDQQPKPFQKTRGEAECVIYGRVSAQ